ncbi:EAL domain-containing protein [Singulisphaera rosea]
MSRCARCFELPAPVPQTGILCIAPPLAHTLGTVRGFLRRSDLAYAEPDDNVLAIPLSAGVLLGLAQGLGKILSQAELRDTRSFVTDAEGGPSLADLASVQPLATLFAQVQGGRFATMIEEGRLTSHFQPIVHAVDPEKVFGYECLLRGLELDGTLVYPGLLYKAARDADFLFSLDRQARLTAIRTAVAHGLDATPNRLFINFNPTSIYDPTYCLRSTVSAIAETRLQPDRIVFEIVESDRIEDVESMVRIVDFYRQAGFQVALDDLGSGFGSLDLLIRLKPDLVKLDMQLVRNVDQDSYKAGILAKLLEMARGLGIKTVAEGIETEGEWGWVREHGADYVQGYLFARPDCPPGRPLVPAGAKASGKTG